MIILFMIVRSEFNQNFSASFSRNVRNIYHTLSDKISSDKKIYQTKNFGRRNLWWTNFSEDKLSEATSIFFRIEVVSNVCFVSSQIKVCLNWSGKNGIERNQNSLRFIEESGVQVVAGRHCE